MKTNISEISLVPQIQGAGKGGPEKLFAMKTFEWRGHDWYLPAPDTELAVWLNGCAMAQCFFGSLDFHRALSYRRIHHQSRSFL